MALKLNVIVASTRPGRVGPRVANWFQGIAKDFEGFDAELVDLAGFNLPVYDEPKHPRLKDYQHEHTKRWAASVDAADAYVFVVPEYNYGPTPALVNAFSYVYMEWNHKPCGFVSYGGVSGGMRGVQMAKLITLTLRMAPIVEGVVVPNVGQHLTEDGFNPTEQHNGSAVVMLKELHRWAEALKPLRG